MPVYFASRDDADDLDGRRRAGIVADADVPADGIGALEVPFREGLVDDGHAVGPALREPLRSSRSSMARPAMSDMPIVLKKPGLTALAIEPAASPGGGW